MATANGEPLLSGKIKLRETGKWEADLEIDLARETAIEQFAADELGRIRVTLEHEGAKFVGTVTTGEPRGERFECRMVGGAGGLDTVVPAKSYLSGAGIKLQQLVDDVLKAAGETLSPDVEDAALEKRLPRWTRSEGPAIRALERIVQSAGFNWRILRDGTVWFGTDTFPDSEVSAIVIDTDPQDGSLTLALEDEGPGPLLLEPCTVFDGRRIIEVTHNLDPVRFRTIASTTTLKQSLDKLLEGPKREIDYSRLYGARVVGQNADGTLELDPDAPMVKGAGIGKVPILLGVPGRVEVPAGTRCAIVWEGGDPDKPRALLWSTSELTKLELGDGSEALALASKIATELSALKSAISGAATAPNDGGSAFKAAILAALSAWPASTASTKIFGE